MRAARRDRAVGACALRWRIVHDPWAVTAVTKPSGSHSLSGELRERFALSIAVVGFFVIGYFGIGWWVTSPVDARSLATPLDAAIPFVPASAIVYWSILPMGLLPIFTVRDPALFRRVALAYSLTIALALTAFVVYPVTSLGFRPEPEVFEGAGFSGWLMHLLCTLDPPMNLFPSLHLALAGLAALAAWRVDPRLGWIALAWTACIAIAVCTTKQHFVADAAAGLALAAVVHFAIVGRRNADDSSRALGFGAPGLALFGLLVALFYGGLFAGYALGLAPWTWFVG